MRLPDSYYTDLAAHYQERRDRLLAMLRAAGFQAMTPSGAYYVMCHIANWGFAHDVEFARYLVQEIGVAAVPGSSFFRDAASGRNLIRFTFCKKDETLEAAAQRLARLKVG